MNLLRTARLWGLALSLLLAASLYADTIGPSCGSCYGATYTLTNLGLQSSTATTEKYRFQYDINTTGFNRGTASAVLTDYIQGVALKVTNNVLAASIISSPAGTWSLLLNTGLANGCTGGGSGYICAQTTSTANVTNGSTYSWLFDITMSKGGLFTTGASIKANYDPSRGIITSESVGISGQTPEPASLALLAAGVGVWAWTRRRRVVGPA